MKLELPLRSELEFVSCNETKTSKANNLKVTIGALKFFSRIIQQLNAIGNCPASAGLGGGDEAYNIYIEEADNDPGMRRASLLTK